MKNELLLPLEDPFSLRKYNSCPSTLIPEKAPSNQRRGIKGRRKRRRKQKKSLLPHPQLPFLHLLSSGYGSQASLKEKQLSFLGSMPVYMRKNKITKNVKPPLPIGPKNITHYQGTLHESFNTVLMKKIFGKKAAQEVAGLHVDQEAG